MYFTIVIFPVPLNLFGNSIKRLIEGYYWCLVTIDMAYNFTKSIPCFIIATDFESSRNNGWITEMSASCQPRFQLLTTALSSLSNSRLQRMSYKPAFQQSSDWLFCYMIVQTRQPQLMNWGNYYLPEKVDHWKEFHHQLTQCFNMCAYQGGHCWSQLLCRIQTLPNPTEWGWNLGEHGYCIEWITILEASSICKELILRCCRKEKLSMQMPENVAVMYFEKS